MTEQTLRVSNPPTLWQRCLLRSIGLGATLLSDQPVANLYENFGVLWNLGLFVVTKAAAATRIQVTEGNES